MGPREKTCNIVALRCCVQSAGLVCVSKSSVRHLGSGAMSGIAEVRA